MANGSRLALELLIHARDTASAVLTGLRARISNLNSVALGGLESAFAAIQARVGALITSLGALGLALQIKEAADAAGRYEALQLQLRGLTGSAEAANAILAELQKSFSPAQVQAATQAYVQLRQFGIQPSIADLKSLIDFNARTGKGVENLTGIIAQLGQMWGKEKMQYEDILILLERGVPVWELLGKATGRNTSELVAMASAGQLGRKELAALVDQMGKASQGASELAAGGWQGLKDQFSALVDLFQRTVVEGGVFQLLKDKLSEINAVLEYAVTSGKAKEWGQQISESLTTAGTYVDAFLRVMQSATGAVRIFVNGFTAGISAIAGAFSAWLANLTQGMSDLAKLAGKDDWATNLQNVADGFAAAASEAKANILQDSKDIAAGWESMAGAFGATTASVVSGYQSLVQESKAAKEQIEQPVNADGLKEANAAVAQLERNYSAGAAAAKQLQVAEDELNIAQKGLALALEAGSGEADQWSQQVADAAAEVARLRPIVEAGRQAIDQLPGAYDAAAAAGGRLAASSQSAGASSSALRAEWIAAERAVRDLSAQVASGGASADDLTAAQARLSAASAALQGAVGGVNQSLEQMPGMAKQAQSGLSDLAAYGLTPSTQWADEYAKKLEEVRKKHKETADSAKELTQSQQDLGKGAQAGADQTSAAATQTGEATDLIAVYLDGLAKRYEALGETSTATWLRSKEALGEAWQTWGQAGAAWQQLVDSHETALKRMEAQTASFNDQQTRMTEEMAALAAAYADGDLSLVGYAEQLENLKNNYRQLGDERLENLRAALEDAKAKTDALTASSEAALSAALEAADSAGNAREIEELRYAALVADLQTQLDEARAAGDAAAEARLLRAMALQQQAHEDKMAQIAAEQAATDAGAGGSGVTDNGDGTISGTLPITNSGSPSGGDGAVSGALSSRSSSTSSTTSPTVQSVHRLELSVGGRTVEASVPAGAETEAFLAALERAQRSAL